jgi:tetratricopeptide (TPR) repeat protein
MRSSIAASTLLLAAVVAASAPAAVAQDSASGTSAASAASAAGANPDALAARAARGAAGAANAALESARKLFAEHRNDEALAAIDAGLKSSPNDARLRFQRGVVLNDSGRSDAAVETFEGLAQDFPELPEPHNNLAVLYAARGDLDRARAALDEAVRALPSYALAHENLGDIHLRLAERAYERATRADSANHAARTKLALARELVAKVSPAGTRPAAAR